MFADFKNLTLQGSFVFWHFSGVEAETLTDQKALKHVPVDFKIYTHYSGASAKNHWRQIPHDASVTTRMTFSLGSGIPAQTFI